MEIAVTGPEFGDFHFESACSTPYISAPSTPKRFGEFYRSAPTSPAHASDFYGSGTIGGRGSTSGIPFGWEEKPGRQKSKTNEDDEDTFYEDDFAFNFSGQMERTSLSAEELFDGGVIRPLKPSAGRQLGDQSSTRNTSVSSPRSPISQGKKMIRDVFSPKQKKILDSFEAGSNQSQNRGRERVPVPLSSRSGRRGTRSLSPCRVPELELEEPQQQQQQQQQHQQENTKSASTISKQSSSSSTSSSSSGSRKWRLRDLLLFRSASEGRASEKDPLRKYTSLPKKHQESIEGIGSPARSSPRRKGPVSPHELHYVTNRAVSEDMKKKTFLPYKQRLLSISKGFGYFTRG